MRQGFFFGNPLFEFKFSPRLTNLYKKEFFYQLGLFKIFIDRKSVV